MTTSHPCGRRASTTYTILGSCHLARVDSAEYLADVLPRLARSNRPAEAAGLLPTAWRDRWAAEQVAAPPAPAADPAVK